MQGAVWTLKMEHSRESADFTAAGHAGEPSRQGMGRGIVGEGEPRITVL